MLYTLQLMCCNRCTTKPSNAISIYYSSDVTKESATKVVVTADKFSNCTKEGDGQLMYSLEVFLDFERTCKTEDLNSGQTQKAMPQT